MLELNLERGAKAMAAQAAHIVALPATQAGHVNPMLELCRRLAPFGFQISFILHPDLLPKFAHKLESESHIKVALFQDPVGVQSPAPLDTLEDLIRHLEGPPAAFIISDAFCGWSQDLADKLGIPRVGLWCASATAEVVCSAGSELMAKGFLPISADLEDTRLIDFLPGIPPMRRTELPLAFWDVNIFVLPLAQALDRLRQSKCILVNTVEELEQEVVDGRRKQIGYFPVGPLIPSSFLDELTSEGQQLTMLTDNDKACIEWLDQHEPTSVLYIAFGSQVTVPYEQVRKIANGLELSGVDFLWALRRNFASESPEGFYEEIEEKVGKLKQGKLVEWSPQASVLAHPSVGGFFTHCGWNSTMEAICSGVPTLCWPLGAEQNINSKTMVDNLKVGIGVAQGKNADFSVEDIARLATALLAGEEGKQARANIQALQATVCGSLKKGGSSNNNLKQFVSWMMGGY